MRITLSVDVVTSPRYMREPPHSLADFGSFSRFRLQEKHNASFYQYVLHSLQNARAKLRKRIGIDKENGEKMKKKEKGQKVVGIKDWTYYYQFFLSLG